MQLSDPTGWLGSDDSGYYSAAEYLLAGETLERAHHQYARMSVVVPVAISMWAFGDSTTAVIAPTVIFSMGCIALVAVAGWLLWGWMEGLIAASVVSCIPYFRVISTAAYPDVHVCFWTTAAVVLALFAIRSQNQRRMWVLGICSGLTIGLACSAKIFGIFAIVPVLWIAWLPNTWTSYHRIRWFVAVSAGVAALILAESLFYLWTAGDFWFRLHAIQNAKADDRYFPAVGFFRHDTYLDLAWNRLTMLLHPSFSGWGRVAAFFIPTVAIASLLNKPARRMGAWAVVTYLFISVTPVIYRHHWHPFTPFDGRHILLTCVPLALCFSWALCRTVTLVASPAWIKRGWPIALLGLAWLSFADGDSLGGFRSRPSQRWGLAISQLIALEDWDDERDIFIPASLYLRHRILFPKELRTRLRVAIDENALDWWRKASVDIESRVKPLPAPTDAYLIATPIQLSGKSGFWDYGVGLPKNELLAWQQSTPRVRIKRYGFHTVGPEGSHAGKNYDVLVLLGGDIQEKQAKPNREKIANAR